MNFIGNHYLRATAKIRYAHVAVKIARYGVIKRNLDAKCAAPALLINPKTIAVS